MNDLLDIEIILKRDRYSRVYNFGIVGVVILGILILIACLIDFRSYVIVGGQVKNKQLELLVRCDEVKYLVDNSYFMIDKKKYRYDVKSIGEEKYFMDEGNNYQYVYVEVDDLEMINNYVFRRLFIESNFLKYEKER